MGLRADDWRLYRVRSFSLSVRAMTWIFAAFVVLSAIIGSCKTISNYRKTITLVANMDGRWNFTPISTTRACAGFGD